MNRKTFGRRVLTACAAAVLPLTLVAFATTAEAATEVGHLQLLPATGNQSNVLDIDTLVPCPASSKYIRVEVYGTGIDPAVQNVMMSPRALADTPADNQYGGYTLPLSEKFIDIFQANNVLHPSGIYSVKALCLDDAAFTVEAEITASVLFTPAAANFSGTYVQQSNAAPTTTTLTAGPADPILAGTPSTLTASVTPTNAPGSVQFKRGTVAIGSPVAVVSGQAVYNGVVPTGAATLTATFLPTDTDAFASSVSAPLDYVVAGPATVTGTARVGAVLTCSIASGGTIGYAWLVNGVASSATTKTVTAGAAWLNKNIGCVATVTKGASSVEQTSPTRKITVGAALKATKKPKLAGTTKVGKKLTCAHGTWSPAASSYTYKWLRNGKVIAGATKSAYKLVKADKGKKISCKVTAKRTAYTSGVATTAAKKVS